MKLWLKITLIVGSSALLGGGYWLLVWRKQAGVSSEDAQILSSYIPDDTQNLPGTLEKSNPFEDSFKGVFKNVFPEKLYKDSV